MGENEHIGGIAVSIVGDYGKLSADIDQATKIATAGGKAIADAFTASAVGADKLADALTDTGKSAKTATDQLKLFDDAVMVPYADAAGQLNMFSDALEPIGEEAQQAAQGFRTMGEAQRAEEAATRAAAAALREKVTALGVVATHEDDATQAALRAAEAQRQATAALNAFTQGAGALVGIGTALTAAITVPLVAVAGASLQSASALQQTTIAFETMLGSAQAAQTMLAELRDFAAKTPFEFTDLTRATQRLVALGFEAKQVIPMLRTVGDAVAGLGGSAEMIDRVTLALGQMNAKGKVSAQEMNQLAEAGIKAWEMVAQKIGVSVPEAMKKAEAGAISAAVAIPAILEGMNAKFAGLMEKQAQTVVGQWSNAKDKIEFILTDLGNAFLPIATTVMQALAPMLELVHEAVRAFGELPQALQLVGIAGAGLVASIGPLVGILGGIGFAIQGVQAALPALSGALQLVGIHAASANIALSGLAGILGVGLVSALAGVALGFYDLNKAMATTREKYEQMDRAFALFTARMIENAKTSEQIKAAQDKINDALDKGIIKQEDATKAFILLGEASKKAINKELADTFSAFSNKVTILAEGTGKAATATDGLRIKISVLQAEVDKNRIAFEKAESTYRSTGKGAAEVAAAYDQWKESSDKLKQANEQLNPAIKTTAASLKKQGEDIRGFTQSTNALLQTIPASYEAYTRKLAEGGTAAKTSLSQLEAAIDKASVMMQGLQGKPLAAMQAVIDKLRMLHGRVKEFVAEDEWNKAAKQIAGFADKYEAELGHLDAVTLDFVNSALAAVRDLEEGLSKSLADAKFVDGILKANERLTAESKKLDEAWRNLAQAGALAVKEYNKDALEAIPITVTLRERVGEAFASIVDFQNEMERAGFTSVALIDQQIQQYSELLKQMNATNQPIQYRLEAEEDLLNQIIRRKELSGAAATEEIYNLEQVRLKQEALYNSTHALGDLAVGVERAMWEGWQDVFMSLSDVIFESKNLGDAMEEIGRKVGKMIVDELANYAFKQLKSAIIGVQSSVVDLNKEFAKLFKTISDAFKPGVPGGGGGKTPGFGGGGGALGMAGDIASIGTLISSIFGNFQMAAVNKSLDVIVNHTLRIFNVLDQWYTAAQDWFGQEFDRLGEIWRDMVAGFEAVVAALGGFGTAVPLPYQVSPKAPAVPGLPDVPSMGNLAPSTYNSSTATNSQKIGELTFNVYAAADPRETARQISNTLKHLSPKYAAFSS